MITYKCKMCGGSLAFSEKTATCTCEYCGSIQTVPRLDDDRRANLYDRANHFRRNNEYDKAMALFEQLLQEDSTDAEAYWSLVLCRYGIEYVEDPKTKKRLPTINRVQLTSVLSDEDYLSALDHASEEQKALYEEEAKQIAAIQKDILSISNSEKPFDVFICYKETDENGRRTPDSVLANELYHELTSEGFKVFFSRITLEDKIGSAYEPYIFAALHSAKAMVVLGTKAEYFNAVWVKNEWSRYLALIRAGGKKTLIPAYRDMDPYDLPDEFSHLQALDMSRLGFMQDMIRGIKKICGKDEQKPQPAYIQQTISNSGVNISNLMKRANLFLEDKNFDDASDYLEKVLDEDAEYAPAYVGKVLITLRLTNENTLKTCLEPFENMSDWEKAMRFATPKQAEVYRGYLTAAKEFREEKRCEEIYDQAMQLLNKARANRGDYSDYTAAWDIFKSIPDFRDSAQRIAECEEKVEAILNAQYDEAVSLMQNGSYTKAISTFRELNNYRDSRELIDKCEKLLKDKQAQLAEKAARREAEAEAIRLGIKKRKTKRIVSIIVVIALVAASIFVYKVAIPEFKYNQAIKARESGEYDQAITDFFDLHGYNDSETQILKTYYMKGLYHFERKAWNSAISAFSRAGDYNNAKELINEAYYEKGKSLLSAGQYDEAIAAFYYAGNYGDAKTQIKAANYEIGKERLENNELDKAITAFVEADDYKDANEQVWKLSGDKFLALERYDDAIEMFMMVENYGDVQLKINEAKYLKAKSLVSSNKLAEAVSILREIIEYRDADALLKNVLIQIQKSIPAFGSYEQDCNQMNGKEPIEWSVLDIYDDGSLLLISKFALETIQYHNEFSRVTWEDCSLRKWLNEFFYQNAFSANEQMKILSIKFDENGQITNGDSYDNDAIDKVSILSKTEVEKYFDDDAARMCVPTEYATAQGAHSSKIDMIDGKGSCCWWLRTTLTDRWGRVDRVCSDGRLDSIGNEVDVSYYCVRPILVIQPNINEMQNTSIISTSPTSTITMPTSTPVPFSMYSKEVTATKVTKASWKTDKQSRINHGITELNILPSENGGHVLSITGWSYGTYTIGNSRGWNGLINTTYITVNNSKNQIRYYGVTVSAGITGIEHTTPYGKNMEYADFICNIDVSKYSDGVYTLGSANHFQITYNGMNNTFSHGYTFGDAYKFEVKNGMIISVG